MYSLKNNPILLPHQIQILKLFFDSQFSNKFFLTGGTALSAFYLAHRDSKDLDLFSLDDFSIPDLNSLVGDIARQTDSIVTIKVSSLTYNEVYLENQSDNWIQRLDFVREQPKRFGEVANIDGIKVDSLENIGSNKVLTIFGRLEPKDYIDLYAIVNSTEWKFDQLFELAKQKDLGLSEFMFANIVAEVDNIQAWPPLRQDVDISKLSDFYRDLATSLLLKIKPSD